MIGNVRLAQLLALVVVAGAATVAAVSLWRSSAAARRLGRRRADEVAELRRNLAAAEAVLKSEPQVMVYWSTARGVQIAVNTLTTVAGLPTIRSSCSVSGNGWSHPRRAT